jgi:hypothetical protein
VEGKVEEFQDKVETLRTKYNELTEKFNESKVHLKGETYARQGMR